MRQWLRFIMILLVLIALLAGGCAPKSNINQESNLRWLTDEEKSKALEIALSTPEATSLLEQQEVYTAEVDWIAIEWDGSRATGWWVLDYDVVSEGVPEFVPESAIIYPRVFLRFGEPVQQQVMVAVDLEAEEAILVEGPYVPGAPPPSRPPVKPKVVPPPREAIVMVKSELEGDRHDQGSGFITSSDGHILAFLSGASMIERLEVVLYDGRTFPAKVINIDPVTELTCIKIEATDLTTLKFAAAIALEIGEKLMAVGYSGEEFKTISAKVLDTDYTLSLPKDNIPAVKLDAGGGSGFAGGPVVNMAGEAVGITLAFDPKTGEAFMVPIDYAGVIQVMRSCDGEVSAYVDPEKTISIRAGQEFAIGLPVIMRLGHKWVESHDNDMLALVGESYIPDDVMKPGCGGYQYFRFRALEAGITEIALALKHSGTGPVVEEKVFKVEIK